MKKIIALSLLLIASPLMADVASSLQIEEQFARSAQQQQRNSAVFMQITNQGDDAAMVNARSDAADIVELHTHINDNGVMRMRKTDKIDLPSGKKVMLKPGGLHVMFIGLKRDLNVGDKVDVTLEFSDGSSKSITAPIHKVMRKHGMKGHMKGDMNKMKHH